MTRPSRTGTRTADDATRGEEKPGRETARLRALFLVPLTVMFVIVAFAWVAALYYHEREEIDLGAQRIGSAAQKLYYDNTTRNAELLTAALALINRDGHLKQLFAQQDRGRLLEYTAPLFAELRNRFNITHLYFTGPDRVNLLRVHQPDRYGDAINRFTTLQAERTGETTHGVELGPLGTFTLRLVSPWYEDQGKQRLIGYVELGMEVDHILEEIQRFLGVRLFILISKEFLEREAWESGMKMLGRPAEWERFPDAVVNVQAQEAVPRALTARLARGIAGGPEDSLEFTEDGRFYRVAFLPLLDAGNRPVGRMAAMIDISDEVASAHRVIQIGGLIGILAVGTLILFFYWLVGRIGGQLERHEQTLRELATHDGLTGLYNHKTFYTILDDEIARARRYGKHVSLLMLDIDHFKRINDQHGHVAGDRVLKELSALITQAVRRIDSVCRYGGEEIAVILPETPIDEAFGMAERLRERIAGHSFGANDGQSLRLTVSIGTASLSQRETSPQELVIAADQALYRAKAEGRNRVCRADAPRAPDSVSVS